MKPDQAWLRLGVLSALVKRSQQKQGRTAVMKFAYLLQTVRGVPLGYHFELYNYGPYDSMVLSDLSQAVTLKAIKSEMISYPSGYGYKYSPNRAIDSICDRVADDLVKYDKDITWVLERFGGKTASQLELISTIVFAQQEMRRKQQSYSRVEICRRVKGIKPHFSAEVIGEFIDELAGESLIAIAVH